MTEKRKPIPRLWWTIAGQLFLVGYPLSIGPAAWALHAIGIDAPGHWLADAAGVVYMPILLLAESSPQREALFLRYIELWVDVR